MKLRILFIKKKYLFLFLFFTLIIILFILFNLTKNPDIPTFTYSKGNSTLKADLNGDGEKDSLYLKEDGNEYFIHVTLDNKDLYLKPDKNVSTLGTKSTYWPIRITLVDVNRDKLPELCVQGSKNNLPVQNIFAYEDGSFKNIFSENNNITGFINMNTNKSPILFSGNLTGSGIQLNSFYLLHNTKKEINLKSEDSYLGKNTIFSFISFMNGLSLNNDIMPKEIVSEQLNSEDYAVIGRLSGQNRKFVFQDAYFIDNKYNNDGELEEIKWTLNFKGISNSNNDDIKNYNLELLLTRSEDKTDNFVYKISTLIPN